MSAVKVSKSQPWMVKTPTLAGSSNFSKGELYRTLSRFYFRTSQWEERCQNNMRDIRGSKYFLQEDQHQTSNLKPQQKLHNTQYLLSSPVREIWASF